MCVFRSIKYIVIDREQTYNFVKNNKRNNHDCKCPKPDCHEQQLACQEQKEHPNTSIMQSDLRRTNNIVPKLLMTRALKITICYETIELRL